METFSALLAPCAGNSPVTGEFPSQRPVTRSFNVFFRLHLKNGWVNNGKAGDLRRHRAHDDVTVMMRVSEHVPTHKFMFSLSPKLIERIPGDNTFHLTMY